MSASGNPSEFKPDYTLPYRLIKKNLIHHTKIHLYLRLIYDALIFCGLIRYFYGLPKHKVQFSPTFDATLHVLLQRRNFTKLLLLVITRV